MRTKKNKRSGEARADSLQGRVRHPDQELPNHDYNKIMDAVRGRLLHIGCVDQNGKYYALNGVALLHVALCDKPVGRLMRLEQELEAAKARANQFAAAYGNAEAEISNLKERIARMPNDKLTRDAGAKTL